MNRKIDHLGYKSFPLRAQNDVAFEEPKTRTTTTTTQQTTTDRNEDSHDTAAGNYMYSTYHLHYSPVERTYMVQCGLVKSS